jgi:hypothetical protein
VDQQVSITRVQATLLNAFASRPGCPKGKDEVKAHCRAIEAFVHDKPIREILGKVPRKLNGEENDLEWLAAAALLRFPKFYPTPAQLKVLYTQYLPPRDKDESTFDED